MYDHTIEFWGIMHGDRHKISPQYGEYPALFNLASHLA